MVSFRTKNLNLSKFWRALDWKMLIHFMALWNIYGYLGYVLDIWDIFRTFGIFYGHLGYFCVHLVHFSGFWYHVPRKIWQPCCGLPFFVFFVR
jgi:hypothetical protein